MAWMSETFKEDKRFLKLQLKRGHIKMRDVEKIVSSLPDVSEKAEIVQVEPSGKTRTEPGETPGEEEQQEG